jgi:hypothetical protein
MTHPPNPSSTFMAIFTTTENIEQIFYTTMCWFKETQQPYSIEYLMSMFINTSGYEV